jgi:hypothetical protein
MVATYKFQEQIQLPNAETPATLNSPDNGDWFGTRAQNTAEGGAGGTAKDVPVDGTKSTARHHTEVRSWVGNFAYDSIRA